MRIHLVLPLPPPRRQQRNLGALARSLLFSAALAGSLVASTLLEAGLVELVGGVCSPDHPGASSSQSLSLSLGRGREAASFARGCALFPGSVLALSGTMLC